MESGGFGELLILIKEKRQFFNEQLHLCRDTFILLSGTWPNTLTPVVAKTSI